MWETINLLLNAAFDLWLWPFRALPAALQLSALALPAALFGLLVFRYTSDQAGIEAAKERIKAHLLELLLFRDDFGVTLRAQRDILKHNLIYMRKAVLPMLLMIGPFVLALIQVESRYAYRSLAPGESTIFSVSLADGVRVSELETELVLSDGLRQETPALRDDVAGEILWRIRAEREGEQRIGVRLGEVLLERPARVGGGRARVATRILRAGDPALLAYPAAVPLARDAPARELSLEYPADRADFGGLSSASWLFMGATLVLGFALRRPLGVNF